MNDARCQPPGDDALLQDLLDGRLEEVDARRVRGRIEREPVLREAWNELRAMQALVRDYGPRGADLVPPPDFSARVRARVAQACAAPDPALQTRARPGRMLRLLTVAYAAAALFALGFGLRGILQSDDAAAPATHTTAARERTGGDPADGGAKDRGSLAGGKSYDKRVADSLEAGSKKDGARLGLPAGVETSGPRAAELTTEREAEGTASTPTPQEAAAAGSRGRFASPGGALRPGLRAPAEAAARKRRPPSPPAADAEPESLERLRDGRSHEVVYVLQAEDERSARQALQSLLVGAMLQDGRDLEAARDDAKDPRPALDFYRIETQEAARELARLERGYALGLAGAAGGASPSAAPAAEPSGPGSSLRGVELIDVVARELSPASAAWLKRQSRVGTWGPQRFQPPAPVEPPAAGRPAAPGKAGPGGAAPAAQPLPPAAPRRVGGASTPAKPADGPAKAGGGDAADGAGGGKTRPEPAVRAEEDAGEGRRVRILVLVRRR